MEHGEGRDRDKGFAAMPANTAGGKPSPWNLYRSPHDECVMKRDRVLEETRRGLAKTGFFLSRPHGERGLCFDFVARRDDTLLIVKVLQNVDALSKDTAHELLEVARILEGSPLVVGERSGTGSLEDGVIYTRFGVSILSRRTQRLRKSDSRIWRVSSGRCSSASNGWAIRSSGPCGAPSTHCRNTRTRRSSPASERRTERSNGRRRSCRT